MKYPVLCLFILFTCVYSFAFAAKVNPEDAQKVAVNWKTYIHKSQKSKVKNQKAIQTINKIIPSTSLNFLTSPYSVLPAFYIFNFAGGGFVIVSADDNINPILAWSDTDSIPSVIGNENIKYWLDKYNKQIYKSISQQISNSTNKELWTNILTSQFSNLKSDKANLKSSNTVGPLLTTSWDQICYYNNDCPADKKGPCHHVVTGCVATALAQIMKYNNYPAKGTGSFSYVDSSYGKLSANFANTTFNWNNMPSRLYSNNTDVANLMYELGVAVKMSYSSDGFIFR